MVGMPMRPAPECLLHRWVHSREEDTESIRTYRPSEWSLPLSRLPRHVLEFEPSHGVMSHVGGPTDARTARAGHWDVEPGEPMSLRLAWRDTPQPALIEVIACSTELLQLRVVSGTIE
jgi:hypothetical protein